MMYAVQRCRAAGREVVLAASCSGVLGIVVHKVYSPRRSGGEVADGSAAWAGSHVGEVRKVVHGFSRYRHLGRLKSGTTLRASFRSDESCMHFSAANSGPKPMQASPGKAGLSGRAWDP